MSSNELSDIMVIYKLGGGAEEMEAIEKKNEGQGEG